MGRNCNFIATKLPKPFKDCYIVSCPEHGITGIFNTVQRYSTGDIIEIGDKFYYEQTSYLAFVKRYN